VCPPGKGHRPRSRPRPREPLAVRPHELEGSRDDPLAVSPHNSKGATRCAGTDPAVHLAAQSSLSPSTPASDTRGASPTNRLASNGDPCGSVTMPSSDDDNLAGVIERKTLADLSSSLVDGSLTYLLADLSTMTRAALVVEDRFSAVFKLEHVQPGWVAELLAAVQVRYRNVPIVFCETRPLAEEWAYRWLGAALAHHGAEVTEPAPE